MSLRDSKVRRAHHFCSAQAPAKTTHGWAAWKRPVETGYAYQRGLIDFRETKRRAQEKLAQMGADLTPDMRVGDLTQAEKVIVAITRALDADARIVVLDEVTASLPTPEAARLHAVLRVAQPCAELLFKPAHSL
jgi:ABC-type branched-subunit amino acid transport system ATPase component